MQKTDVLLGLQWGDEGKGKAVDVIAPSYDIIARFQGGPNAGHTLEIGDQKIVLNTIPSGVFRKEALNVIGNGVVINPIVIQIELERLATVGLDIEHSLLISKRAHFILPTHPMLDAALELSKGADKIGSTLRGIGPTYRDKIVRAGLRVGDLLKANFRELVNNACAAHNIQLKQLSHPPIEQSKIDEWLDAAEKLKKFKLIDAEQFIYKELKKGKRVLAEGAQGTLLDIDFGSYPFVTSSNTISGGACTGLGIAPNMIGEVYGISKAYCTRVGSGPFPTELFDDVGAFIAKAGHEFGATTGRPRRCGWMDLPALRYAIRLNGTTQLILTKADVLSGLKEIKACTSYRVNGEITEDMPYDLHDAEAIYQTFDGWEEDITQAQSIDELPKAFLEYVQFIEEAVEVPISILSVGPKRSQTIFIEPVRVS